MCLSAIGGYFMSRRSTKTARVARNAAANRAVQLTIERPDVLKRIFPSRIARQPLAAREKFWRRATIGSSSLLAMATALGWSGYAYAATDGTCTGPTGGTVNCTAGDYGLGEIVYTTDNSDVDDLTINVGTGGGDTYVGGRDYYEFNNDAVPGGVKSNTATNASNYAIFAYSGIVSTSPVGAEYTDLTVNVGANTTIYAGQEEVDPGIYFPADHGPGIYVNAYASGPDAYAAANVNNRGKIYTYGEDSAGIDANAYATGDATAITTVTNTNTIGTFLDFSPAIYADSYATSTGVTTSYATAETLVTNHGYLFTDGFLSNGISAYSTAVATSFGSTEAYAESGVSNTATIRTFGEGSAGIDAFADAISSFGYPSIAEAKVDVFNSGYIYTDGADSSAIVAGTYSAATGTRA
jgi:hypothetical protein